MAVAPFSQPLPSETPIVAPRSQTVSARFLRHPLARVGLVLLVVLLFTALFAKQISYGDASYNFPNGINSLGVPHSPVWTHKVFFLGADSLGRDVWTRVTFGARISLFVAFCALITSTLIGTIVGLIGGYFGGRVDTSLTRLTEIIACLPTILLAITLTLVLPDTWREIGIFKTIGADPRLIIAIGLVTWTGIARSVRGQVLSLKEREFVEAAHALGVPSYKILSRHLLPNALPTIIALAPLSMANNMLLEGGLSFLGLGDPSAPSWGGMISEGQPYFSNAPWITLSAGIAMVLAVIAFNLLGNALNETLDVRR